MEHGKQAKEPAPFYCSPKIHKKKLGSRPISAHHSYILAPLSKKLADVLLDTQYTIKDICKDSKSFVQNIEQFKAPKEFVFVTFDVEACYPNINIPDAINTLKINIGILRDNAGFGQKF